MLNPRLTEEEKPKTQLPPLQPIDTATPPLPPTPRPALLEPAPLDTAQDLQAEPPRLLDPSRRFNFARAKQAGVSDSDLLGFLQAQDTNIDWEALEQITPDPAQKIAMLSRNDWSFYKPLETPQTPTKQALEETPPELPQTPTKTPQEASNTTSTLNPRKTPPTERKNLFDRAAELAGFQTDRGARIDKDTEDYIYSAQQEGRGFDDLDKSTQAHLAEKAQAEKDLLDIFTTPQELARALYDKEKKAIEIAKTPQAALTPEQKAHIKKEASLFQKIFSDDEEIYRDFIETERARKIVPQEMKHALEVLDNLHGHKDIASLLTGSNEELKSDYLESVHTIATNLGFSGIATNAKGEIFIEKDKQYYRVESGFIESLPTILLANTGSIGAGIAGSIAGFKYGSRLGGAGATAGAILGGGIGAFTGGAADVVLGNLYLNRENTASEILAHATQEGVLSVVGDTVILGALKAYDKLSAGGGIKNALGTITDYIPVVGLSKRFFDGNAKRAQELLATSYTTEQLQALQQASLDFGANLTLGDAKKNFDNLADKLGADSPLTQGYEKLSHALRLDTQRSTQESFLQAIRADEHGTLTAFLSEAAAQSPTAQRNLANILNATTARLTRELEALKLDKGDIKRVFDDLESGTKDSYNQAMTDVLENIYNDSYKVNLNELKEKTGRQGDSTQSLSDIVALIESEQQKGRNMPLIGRENVTPELLEYVQKNNKKIAIEKLDPEEARELGFKHPEDARVTITADAINHILRRHGVDSPLVKNGQPPIKLFEISNVPSFKPDERFKITNEHGEKIVIGFKQVNGHFTVVQHMKTKHNELDLKTMYKENGDYQNSEAYKRLKNNPEATALTPSYEGYGRVMSPTAIITREGDYTPKKANENQSPTTTPNPQSFQKFKDDLERAGVTPQESANFLNFIEKNIYNPQGVTFTQLNNALKNLNSYYKQAQDPNFKDHIKRALDNFLRQDIKAGVEAIFAQNQPAYKSALSLYESALQDYATMKSTLKLADKLKLRNAATTQTQALETLLKIAKGQGEKGQNNIAILTKALDQNNRALVELNMLQTLLEKSLIDKEALRVLDSGKFMSEVKKLAENDTFTTPHAKEYINLVEKFHELFKNDALLAKAIKPTLTEKMGSSIATSIEGAVRMQATKQIFSHIVRLLPKLYIPSVDKRVAGAALRYHLRQALESSHSISELNHRLEALPRSRFTNDTYKILEEITGRIDRAQDEILQQAQRTTALQSAKYQDQARPAPALGENFPSYYHTGAQAIEKLLQERQGQVAGAFYREDLGDIDLAWGQVAEADNRGFGLAKIERNAERGDFEAFGGGEQGLINALSEIIERGKLVESGEENIQTLWLKQDSSYYLAGLSKGFYEEGGDKWLLTSFKKETPEAEDLEKLERLFNEGQEVTPTPTPLPEAKEGKPASLLDTALHAREQELAEREARSQAKREADTAHFKAMQQANEERYKDKLAQAGKDELERALKLGEPIELRRVEKLAGRSSVSLDDSSIYPLDYAIIKANDLKPNFHFSNLQTRTGGENTLLISKIASDFRPEMVINRGGFDDLPIIAPDGQVISGNHRAQGILQFNPESRDRYEQAIKDSYDLELASDEVLVRIPASKLSERDLLALAASSNSHRSDSIGDKVLASLGQFSKQLQTLPAHFESEAADELALKVARHLDTKARFPDPTPPNLALLAHLSKHTGDNSLPLVLNTLEKDLSPEHFYKVLDMYSKNAGALHNLTREADLSGLNLPRYLLDSIAYTGRALRQADSRAQNFQSLLLSERGGAGRLRQLLETTSPTNPTNPLINQNPREYEELIAQILGYGMAVFARRENPARALYDFLKEAPERLRTAAGPNLFDPDKKISDIDIFDFIRLLLAQGEESNAVREVAQLLDPLKERYYAYEAGQGRTTVSQAPAAPQEVTPPKEPAQEATPTEAREPNTNKPQQKSLFDSEPEAKTSPKPQDTPESSTAKAPADKKKKGGGGGQGSDSSGGAGEAKAGTREARETGTSTANKQDPSPEGFRKLIKSEPSLADTDVCEQVRAFFHANASESQPKEIRALFDKVLDTASKLEVRLSPLPEKEQFKAGVYKPFSNDVRLLLAKENKVSPITSDKRTYRVEIQPERLAKTLFHELIHSTITRAQIASKARKPSPYEKKVLDSLTPAQKQALQEITNLYKVTIQDLQKTRKLGLTPSSIHYGLTNEKEFIAELANPEFRNFLKEQNIFSRIVRAVVKFFTAGKSKKGDQRTTTLQALRDAYERYLDNFNYEKARAIPNDTSKGDAGIVYKLAEGQAIDKEQALTLLKSLQGEELPPSLDKQGFLESGLSEVINKENFLQHLETREDSAQRIAALNLVEPTFHRPDLELLTRNERGEETRELIKVFTDSKKRKFYVLITPLDNEKVLLTGIPTSKEREIKKRIRKALDIQARDSGVVSSAQSHNETPTPAQHSTTKKQTKQDYPQTTAQQKREQRGIYNVTYNEKIATLIKQDLESIEQALRLARGDENKGALHILGRHLQNPKAQGYITDQELLNMGNSVRSFAKENEPLLENGARIYEWADREGVRFRLIVGEGEKQTEGKQRGGDIPSRITSTSAGDIVTLYSDRNLNEKMVFKNPKVAWENKTTLEDYFTANTTVELDRKINYAKQQKIGKKELQEAVDFLNLWEHTKSEYDFNDKKALDLLKWHSTSSEATKYSDGIPLIFFHGTSDRDLNKFEKMKDNSMMGTWLSPDSSLADSFARGDSGGTLACFIKLENPLRADKFTSWGEDIEKRFIKETWGKDYTYPLKQAQKIHKQLQEAYEEIEDISGHKVIEALGGQEWEKGAYDSGEWNIAEDGIERLIVQDLDTLEIKFWDMNYGEWSGNKGEGYKYKIAKFLQGGSKAHEIGNTPIIRSGFDIWAWNNWKSGAYLKDVNIDTIDLKATLERMRYDGIIYNPYMFVAFKSNQIKHIDNKGSWVDKYNNVSPKKPKEAKRHNEAGWKRSYFNEHSPNIMMSSPHAGAGMLGGMVAGVETDENGNTYFNPESFVKGLLLGAGASKASAVGLKGVIRYRAGKVARAYPNIAQDNPALMHDIAKADLHYYARASAYNALTQFFNKHKWLDASPQFFAGEKALVNEAYKPHARRLEKAKELLSRGASSLEIWDSTGWYKDKDNKWKFEISQKGGKLNLPRDFTSGKLGEILQDRELFQAYPQLQDLRVSIMSKEEYKRKMALGFYNPDKKEIVLNIHFDRETLGDPRDTLYHEIQHAVQDIEGFAYGFKDPRKEKHHLDYYEQHGEVEARNVSTRLHLPTQREGYKILRKGDPRHSEREAELARDKEYIANQERISEITSLKRELTPEEEGELARRREWHNKRYKEAWEKYYIPEIKEKATLRAKHPYATMDIDINDTIAEATMQGEALSKGDTTSTRRGIIESQGKTQGQGMDIQNTLRDIFLHNGALDFSRVKTQELPKANFNNTKQFSNLFTNKQGKFGIIQTPYKDIKVDMAYAYRHFYQNTHNANRDSIKGAFFDTFAKPLFIAQKETDKGLSTYYYKVYDYGEGKIGIFGIGVDENGLVDFKTLYADKGNQRINHILNSKEAKVLYIDTEQLLAR